MVLLYQLLNLNNQISAGIILIGPSFQVFCYVQSGFETDPVFCNSVCSYFGALR